MDEDDAFGSRGTPERKPTDLGEGTSVEGTFEAETDIEHG